MASPVRRKSKLASKPGQGLKRDERRMTKTNLSLSDASLDTIEQLKDTTEAVTTAEVVRRALEFYRLAVEQQKAGAKIVFKDPKGTENAVIIL